MSAIPPNLIGVRLGHHEILAEIGRGGMATVYRGFDHNLDRPVAVKVLSDAAAAEQGYAARFRQEARLVARLRHPHIVQVHDFGERDGIVYMVQELLPGPTLGQRLSELHARQQPMPRREILAVIQQIAAALDAAHAAGIIHRDVKPSNVIANGEGAYVLTDFGIAKAAGGTTTITQAGVVLGTPVYIAPEQARGEALTPASDIYALGVVLYELIGGRPPFDDPTPLGTVLRHLNETPPPLQPLRPSVPPAVEEVVRRALAKRPDERFATASALALALEVAWPEPAAHQAPGDIHGAPTTIWQPSGGRSSPPRVASPPAPPAGAPAPVTVSAPAGSRRLVALAAALAAVLLAGALLAWRGAGSTSDTSAAAPAAEATPAQTAAHPEQTAVTGGPLHEVRESLGAAAPADVLSSIDASEQALAAGDGAAATEALGALQRQILRARRDGTISAEQMRAALGAVEQAAAQSGLRLPLQPGS